MSMRNWRDHRGTLTVVSVVMLTGLLLASCGQGQAGAEGGVDGSPAQPDVPAEPEEPGASDVPAEPDESAAPSPGDTSGSPTGVDLILTSSTAGAEQERLTLVCDFTDGPPRGDYPDTDQACADLLTAFKAGDPFAPVPADAMCTQIFGGEAVVDVSGTVSGPDGQSTDVQSQFALNNGCEIERWERLGAVLSPYRDPA